MESYTHSSADDNLSNELMLKKVIRKEFSEDNFEVLKEFEGSFRKVYLVKINDSLFIVKFIREKLLLKKNNWNKDNVYNEICVLKYLERLNIPSTRLISYDMNQSLGFNYIISTYVDGDNINLDSPGIQSLIIETMSLLHKKKINGFGEIIYSNNKKLDFLKDFLQSRLNYFNKKLKFEIFSGIEPHGKFNSWEDFLQSKLNDSYRVLNNYKVLNSKNLLENDVLNEIDRLWGCIKKDMFIKKGVFLHGDFHLKNCLFQKNKFSGFVDLKSCIIGDPIWDYARFFYHTKLFFLPDYIPLTNQNLRKFYFYVVFFYLRRIINMSHKGEPENIIVLIKKRLIQAIEQLNEIINQGK